MDQKTSQLSAASALTGAEVIPLADPLIISADFVADFGGVGNGSTDNSDALNDFGDWARTQSALGKQVWLTVPVGIFNFVNTDAFTSQFGIRNYRMACTAGAVFQNTNASGGASPWVPASFSNLHEGSGAVVNKIASCSAGATQVTLLTVADAANYAVGQPVVIMSEDIQISSSNFSYPPNANLFDYVTVLSNNPSTGVVTFTPALGNSHSANNIDGPTSNTHLCGKARIWKLNGTFGIDYDWDARHTIVNAEFGIAPNSGAPYIAMVGRYQRWENCTMGGISPTIAETIEVVGGESYDLDEPDKLVKTLTLSDRTFDVLTFQSSSIDDVLMEDCIVVTFLASGLVKRFTGTNNTVPMYSDGVGGTSYGHNLITTLNGGTIASWPYRGEYASATVVYIDGVDVTYADGVITVPKSLATLASWNVVPNVTCINLSANDRFTGDLGSRMVTSLTEDATNIYYHVETWGASLPAYAVAPVLVRLSRHGPLYVNNVTGCPEIVSASTATAAGKFPWQLLSATLTGTGSPLSGNWNDNSNTGHIGNLVRAVINVTVAGGSLLSLEALCRVAADMTSPVSLLIEIDTTLTGVRTFTQGVLAGKVGSDDVKLSAVSQSALPVGKWVQTPFVYYLTGSPNVTVELEFDTGIKFRSAGA